MVKLPMSVPLNILFLEDDRTCAAMVKDFISDTLAVDWQVMHVTCWAEARHCLAQQRFDLALSDLFVPDSHGLDTVLAWRQTAPQLPLVVMTADADPALGVEAVRQGAQDYLFKGEITPSLLEKSVRYALERARNQALLQQSEQRLTHLVAERTTQWQRELQRRSALFEVSRDGIVLLDVQGQVVEANPRFAEMLGYSLEDMAQLQFQDWVVDDAQQTLLRRFQTLCRERRDHFCEMRHRRKDGTCYDVEVSATAFQWQADTWMLCTCRDISDRKRAEAALAASEATNRAIVEAIPDLLIRTDYDGNYHCVRLGHPQEVVMVPGTPMTGQITDVLPPDMAARRLKYVRQALETGQVQVYEHVFEVAGDRRDEESRIVPLNDREVLVIVRNITGRKQIEAERLRTEKMGQALALLETLLDVVLGGYWHWDMGRQSLYLSPGFKRMFGYRDWELPNTLESWQDLLLPEDLPALWQGLEAHWADHGNSPWHSELRYRHRDGSTIWVAGSGQVIEWDPDGQPLRMIGCHINISDRKAVEMQLQRTNAELLRATRLKDEFLATMSHELRTPLNAILGMAEVLQEQVYGSLNPQQRKSVKTIERSGNHLLELINDILDVAKIEAQQMTLTPQPVSVRQLCEASLCFVKQLAQKKRLRLRLDLPPQLPQV
ncbi:MAG: PAS domain S-box protein, partial [Leptolyngbya sp.]|nr:PAS domain S-box protein [Leptolyngbya sp.]